MRARVDVIGRAARTIASAGFAAFAGWTAFAGWVALTGCKGARRDGKEAEAAAAVSAGSRERAATPIFYFVLTDRFDDADENDEGFVDRASPGAYHGGDLRGVRRRLDHLAALGVDVLWISPVVDNVDHPVTGAGFPDWGYHGYWPKDLSRIEPRQGTEDDLRALVAAAHARGMRVLLDAVVNHVGYGAPLADDPSWTRSPARGDCGADDETRCLFGLPDLRTERPEIAEPIITAHVAWLERSGADGLRIDAAKHVDRPFLEALARRAKARGAFLLGEVWGTRPGDPFSEQWLSTFDALYDFAFQERVLAFVTGQQDARAFADWLRARGPNADRFVTFLNTHDTPGFLHRVGGDRDALLLGATLLMTLPGAPLVYYGDEVARPGGEWPWSRGDMLWAAPDGADVRVLAVYRALARVHDRLVGPLRVLVADGGLLVYARGHGGVVAVNVERVPRVAQWPGRSAPVVVGPRSAMVLFEKARNEPDEEAE